MKKLFSLLLSFTLLVTMIPTTVAAGFADVDSGAWYADAVDYVVSNKLMSGYNATTFGTHDTLSRAMVVQILYNKEGTPAQSGSHSFNDVKASDWFNNAVTWGTRKGVMSGYGGGKFAPNDDVTIEQIAVILWNYSGKPAFSASADRVGSHSSWAANGLGWAVENGILDNVPFDAVTEGATRAQTAQMLTNYLTGSAAPAGITGISLDITEHKMGEDWTQYLTATLYPAGAEDTITWTSSNPKVATVNERGKVSGVAGGEAIITATTSNGKTATCTVEVWHSHELTAVRESSCLTAGFERYTCTGCGHSYDKYLPAVGGEHRWFTDYCTRCGISPCDYSQVTPFANTGYPEYDRLIAEYAFTLALGYDQIDTFEETCTDAHGRVSFDWYFVDEALKYGWYSSTPSTEELYYSIYDIDANGTPELLIVESVCATPEGWNEWGPNIVVYGLNANKEATYLGAGIYRSELTVLTDGRLLEAGSDSAFRCFYSLYRVTENGKKRLIEAYVYDERGPEEASSYIEGGYKYITAKEWSRRFDDLKANSIMHKPTWIPIK